MVELVKLPKNPKVDGHKFFKMAKDVSSGRK